MAENKSDDVNEEGRRLSPGSLFPYCKIVTSAFGYLELKEENLQKVIIDNVKCLGLPKNIPVAVLAVIGPPSSGKSFFTNLLIQYYKTGGDGGWLEMLTKKGENGRQPEMAGFQWGSVNGSSPSIFRPSRATDLATSGVYLWPQPFLMKHAGEKDLLVWILHLCRGVDKEDEDLQTLERFLLLASSRVTEIDFGNKEFRILKETLNLKVGPSHLTAEDRIHICDSIVYLFRSKDVGSKSKAVTDDEAKAALTKLLAETSTAVDPSVLENFKHINVTKLKEAEGRLHDENGCLNIKAEKNMTTWLKQIVALITAESEVTPIKNGEEELHLSNFFLFLKSCVNTVNLLSPYQSPKLPAERSTVSIPPTPSDDAAMEVKKSSPKIGMKWNHPEPTSSDRGEQLQNEVSGISGSQFMLKPGLGPIGQTNFGHGKTSGCGSLAMRSDVQKEHDEKHISQQQTKCDAMDTTPAPDPAITENTSGHVMTCEKTKERNETIEKPNDPMDIDNPVMEEAAKKMLSAEENKRKAEKARLELLQAQKKREEKERLEMEEKQKEGEMLIVANQAVLQMKAILPSAIENWLRKHFHVRNIEEIKNIYSHALRGVQTEGHKTVDVQLWKALDRKIDAEAKDYCMAYLTDLQTRMQTFYRQVKKKFDYHDCFTANELEKLCNEEYDKVHQNLESNVSEKYNLLGIGCKMIGDYVYEQNAKIIANEESLAQKLMPMVLKFYNEEMARFLQEGVYAPNNLKEIHSNLISRWVEGFRKSFRLTATGKTCQNVENQLEDLKAKLVQGFQKHLQQNNKNLQNMQQQISRILEASKNSYVEKIEDVLNKNSDGLEMRELTRRQLDIVNEAKTLLKMEIQQKIRRDEPLEEHVKSLQAYIDNYWKCVLVANSKNLQKRKEREEEDTKKREEQRKAEAQEQEKRRKAEKEKAVNERKTESKTDSTSFQTKAKGVVRLPPLVFQLQSTRIRMGMYLDSKPRVLSNVSGEQSTPLVVGLTNGGNLIYGTEAQANIPEEDNAYKSELLKHWWVANHLITSGSLPWTDDIRLNGEAELHTITVEFLLGFILKQLKEHVEAHMNGVISTAVITVPCWLCSSQRIQVKDGGKLAGFTEIYLINEAAAAAYACASSDARSRTNHNILILSENSGNIDASVYSHSTYLGAKKVTLVGHCGSYCMEETTRTILKTVRDLFGKGVKYIWNGITGTGDKSVEDKQHQAVQQIRKVVKQAQDPIYNSSKCFLPPNEVFVISELEEWRPMLEQLGKEKERKICDIDEENGVVIGASLLSQNPNKIKEHVRDKLIFEVMRKCQVGTGAQVISKEMLPTTDNCRKTTTFSKSAKEAAIFQNGLQGDLDVGYLKLHRVVLYDQSVEVSLGLNNEAIVDVKCVKISSSNHKSKDPVLTNEYEWITPNLTREDFVRLEPLLGSLGSKQKGNSELLDAKKQLLQQCNEMKMQLEEGTVFKIKSEVVKGMFLKRIEDAIKFAEHENSTLEQIQGQMDALAKWSSKYLSSK